jgi:hypothetical protein
MVTKTFGSVVKGVPEDADADAAKERRLMELGSAED